MSDLINHPPHYVNQAVQIEPIDVLRYAPFDLGNALKYLIRAGHKDDELQDLKKASWYLMCAEDSYSKNPAPYIEFIKHYSHLLSKFRALRHYNPNGDLFRQLQQITESRIAKIEVRMETSTNEK